MCNCRNRTKCPLEVTCKSEGVVYKAVVENENGKSKVYVVCTERSLKKKKMVQSPFIIQTGKI